MHPFLKLLPFNFKQFFPVEFYYCLPFDATKTYALGEKVLFEDRVYVSLMNDNTTPPEPAVYPLAWNVINATNTATDNTINQSFQLASMTYNISFIRSAVVDGVTVPPDKDPPIEGQEIEAFAYSNQQVAFLYLSAHYLQSKILATTTKGNPNQPASSQSLPGISKTNLHHYKVTDIAWINWLYTTAYGQMYYSMCITAARRQTMPTAF